MDDLTFRRRIYADPNDKQQDIIDACDKDKSKAQFKNEMQQFDKKLSDSLHVDVPDNLADRILLGQTIDFQKAQKQRKTRMHLSIAASVLFAVVFSVQYVFGPHQFDTLGDHALAHIYHEEHHLWDNYDYSSEDLNVKLASFGASLSNSVAPVTFASFCRFDGVRSLHLVFQGENSPVTVFIVPHEAQLAGTEDFSDQRFQGKVTEFQNANMVIVTEKTEDNEAWQQKLKNAIDWQKA